MHKYPPPQLFARALSFRPSNPSWLGTPLQSSLAVPPIPWRAVQCFHYPPPPPPDVKARQETRSSWSVSCQPSPEKKWKLGGGCTLDSGKIFPQRTCSKSPS